MRNISALTLFAILLLATSLDAFRLPYYARDDPYLQQILTPRNGAKGPNQYQIYMAREYLDEMEQYEDPHDTVEDFLEPHFLWESKFIFLETWKNRYFFRGSATFLVSVCNFFFHKFFYDVSSQKQTQ